MAPYPATNRPPAETRFSSDGSGHSTSPQCPQQLTDSTALRRAIIAARYTMKTQHIWPTQPTGFRCLGTVGLTRRSCFTIRTREAVENKQSAYWDTPWGYPGRQKEIKNVLRCV